LISELAECVGRGVSGERSTECDCWVEYQKLLVKAMSLVAYRGAREIQTGLEASRLLAYAGYDVAQDVGYCRLLRIRPEYSSLFPDEFLARIELGSVDTLQMFAKVESKL